MSINGAHLLHKGSIGKNCAARGFFDVFYRLNTLGLDSSCCVSASSRRTKSNSFASSLSHNAQRAYSTTTITSPQVIQCPSEPQTTPTTATTRQTEPPLSTTLRTLMRTIPHSVVLLTTSIPPSSPSTLPLTNTLHKPKPQLPVSSRKGMTLSSFTTLTLTPSPIITFNIRKPSQTLEALKETRWFLIHVLNGNKNGHGARIAERFTKGNSNPEEVWAGLDVEDLVVDEEKGVVCPRVMSAKGVRQVLVCEVEDGIGTGGFVEVGDHVVVVAGVRAVVGRGEVDKKAFGLIYADGRYRGIGGVIGTVESKEMNMV